MTPDPFLLGRREILRLGAIGAGGLSLARFLELRELAPLRIGPDARLAKERSMILVWLDGGASHVDTFDAKPRAPIEIRGDWRSVEAPIRGVHFGEGLERLAAALPHFALIRSLTSEAGEHGIARHLMLTGYPVSPSMVHPSHGSVVSSRIADPAFPPYLTLAPVNEARLEMGPGFLPPEFAPFAVDGNPARPEFVVRDLHPPRGVTPERVSRRRSLQESFDRFRRSFEHAPDVRARTSAFERAYRLVGSRASREAFDLSKESDATRSSYGGHPLGQCCLMARRLVEAGARFVSIVDDGWDTHARNFDALRLHRLPKLDQSIPVLLQDLAQRGLADDVVVLVMGDFGRTPKVNAMDGRDHWPRAASAILAGGGVRGGTVVGATDDRGEQVVERPVTPADLSATIYTLLGVDPAAEIVTRDQRPIRLVREGEPVHELLA